MHGRVEHTPSEVDSWTPAALRQELVVGDGVRTFVASRAAVLFVDETLVKLNADAVLRVEQVDAEGQAPSIFNLLSGEGWFRTKNPRREITIETAAVTTAIRGTEINLRVDPNGQTVLTVIEGSVDFFNAQGAIPVNAGEEATAVPGQAPIKRTVLNPDDAVQWALYYPTAPVWADVPAAAATGPAGAGLELLRAGDAAGTVAVLEPLTATEAWAPIALSMAYTELGALDRAQAVLEAPATGEADELQVEQRAQRAAVALAAGDTVVARRELDAALAVDPTALRPLVLQSSLELTRNEKDLALAAAEAAVAAHPDSVGAHLAAGEAAQAFFDLDQATAAYDRALELDPTEVRAIVNRARVRFGTGDTSGARADAESAAALLPQDAQVLSLQGFIALAGGDTEAARSSFEQASMVAPEFGEPHLGLGLVHFRNQQQDEGLLALLVASLLEPSVALYQSYLGKAYYQLGRFDEGLSTLETAKRLDPRDPTPWLYASFFLRDRNQQSAAIEELRQAIALNDNRAVYRSRFLLDRDLATKNVSLAQVYRELGFEAWGASEALDSVNADITNASAHLFLAETYGNLPDRTQALSSELLQYYLYAPVNRNAFNNFNEYTALLEEPRRQTSIRIDGGDDGRFVGDAVVLGGNERVAYNGIVSSGRLDGARGDDADTNTFGFAQAKFALGTATDLFANVAGSTSDAGDDFENVVSLTALRRVNLDRDPTLSRRSTVVNGTVGFRHEVSAGSTFTAALQLRDSMTEFEDPDVPHFIFEDLLTATRSTFSTRAYDFQAQQVIRLGRRHQIVAGAGAYVVDQETTFTETAYQSETGRVIGFLGTDDADMARAHGYAVWLRDEMELSSAVHVTAGIRFQEYGGRDIFAEVPQSSGRWDPRVGLSLRVHDTTRVRIAAFSNFSPFFSATRISPTSVSGFLLDRSEFSLTERREADVSIDSAWGRVFQSVQVYRRDTEERPLFLFETSESQAVGLGYYLNYRVSSRWTVFGDNLYARTETLSTAAPELRVIFDRVAFARRENQLRVGVNFIHGTGVSVRLTNGYVTQRFPPVPEDSSFGLTELDLEDSAFNLTDASVRYEFAAKRGLASLQVRNLFDRRFAAFIEGISVRPPLPEREVVLSFRWRL